MPDDRLSECANNVPNMCPICAENVPSGPVEKLPGSTRQKFNLCHECAKIVPRMCHKCAEACASNLLYMILKECAEHFERKIQFVE